MPTVRFQTVLEQCSLQQFVTGTSLFMDGLQFRSWDAAPFSATVETFRTRATTYCRLQTTGRLGGCTELSEDAVLIWMGCNGRQKIRLGSQTLIEELNIPFLFSGTSRHRHEFFNIAALGVWLKRDFLHQEARQQGIIPQTQLSPFSVRLKGAYLLRQLLLEIEFCLQEGRSDRTLLLLHQALITVVIQHWIAPSGSGSAVISSRSLQRALDWLQERLTEPVQWSDLCEELGITQRSLQLAFARELNTTPSRWLKERRLERLHQQLSGLDGCPDGRIVPIVESCGLPYSSSTLSAYRSLFRETPSQTLRNHNGHS